MILISYLLVTMTFLVCLGVFGVDDNQFNFICALALYFVFVVSISVLQFFQARQVLAQNLQSPLPSKNIFLKKLPQILAYSLIKMSVGAITTVFVYLGSVALRYFRQGTLLIKIVAGLVYAICLSVIIVARSTGLIYLRYFIPVLVFDSNRSLMVSLRASAKHFDNMDTESEPTYLETVWRFLVFFALLVILPILDSFALKLSTRHIVLLVGITLAAISLFESHKLPKICKDLAKRKVPI